PREGADKDTARNIRQTRELVVNLVPPHLADAMNVSASDFDPQTDEIGLLNLRTAPSHTVRPPRIAESPVALECGASHILDMPSGALIVLAKVKVIHVADDFVINPEKCYIDAPRMSLLARMQGVTYGRVTDLFDMKRLDPEAAFLKAKELTQPRSALADLDEPELDAVASLPVGS
ncbi:MAG: flavin reductase, partial [Acetobacteraceae bacterium]|nr:flavin reductase [Acetobacteraceae bacterium]